MFKRILFILFVLFGIGVGVGLRAVFSRPVTAAIDAPSFAQPQNAINPASPSAPSEQPLVTNSEASTPSTLSNLEQTLITPITDIQQIKQILMELGERNRLWYAAQTGWLHRTGAGTTNPIILADNFLMPESSDAKRTGKRTSESWYRIEENCQYEGYFIESDANGEILQTVVTTPAGLSVNLTLFELGYTTDALTLPDEQENYPVEFTGYSTQMALSDINQLENAVPSSLQVSAYLAPDNPSHVYITLTWKFSQPDAEAGTWLGLEEAMIGASETFGFDLQTGLEVFFENRYEAASGVWVIATSSSSNVVVVAELPQQAEAMFDQLILQANAAAGIE